MLFIFCCIVLPLFMSVCDQHAHSWVGLVTCLLHSRSSQCVVGAQNPILYVILGLAHYQFIIIDSSHYTKGGWHIFFIFFSFLWYSWGGLKCFYIRVHTRHIWFCGLIYFPLIRAWKTISNWLEEEISIVAVIYCYDFL